ncbi:MAG TPA: carboxylating nicotinate-nucleotide diphosphorylase [Verrucomicrobiae bacterium]|jgi:nicotinate-nucleotide pyrophosphorylase (carboxylating)|nr:carboxylating nicotinate-nucleotide diphosphorylase [Verrucomicrobiae bacterium]
MMTAERAPKAQKEKKASPVSSFIPSEKTRALLRAAFDEDFGRGDLTSELVVSKTAVATAKIFAREPGIFCGAPALLEIFKCADPALRAEFPVKEGAKFRKNTVVLILEGPVQSILRAERTALNLLGHLSGIATMTRAFVDAVKGYPVLILDTRKTMPLWRELEKYAVRAGGGRNHRMGLYDAVFVKENHRPYGDLKKLSGFKGSVEIEVRNREELREAVKLHPRVILFDNFPPFRLKQVVQIARRLAPETILEASGGITLENVGHYAAMGVDWISVGALTHSVRSLDFSLLLK